MLAPVVSWVVWVSWSVDKPSDGQHVAWFVTVAAAAVLAGREARHTALGWLLVWPVALAAALGVLYAWWSTSDDSGLFMAGLIMGAPFIALAAMVLVAIGQSVPRRGRRAARPAPGR